MFQHSEFTWWQMQPTFSHSSGILWRHPNTATTEFWLLRWYVEMMTYKMFKWQLALSTTAVVLLKTEFVHLQVLRIVLKLLHQNNISSRKELITEFKGVKIHAKLTSLSSMSRPLPSLHPSASLATQLLGVSDLVGSQSNWSGYRQDFTTNYKRLEKNWVI